MVWPMVEGVMGLIGPQRRRAELLSGWKNVSLNILCTACLQLRVRERKDPGVAA